MENCGYAVYNPLQTVRKLCYQLFTYCMQPLLPLRVVHVSAFLYPALYAAYTKVCALVISGINRGKIGLIPTIHRPYNKDYMGYLKVYNRKTVEGLKR
jgi:hypothetical protein